MPTPEQAARETIDAQLSAAGWTVQNIGELNLSASRGVAVREMQSHGGPADYILFVDGKALGIVEAKKEGTTLSAVAEQSARYTAAHNWIPQRWADPLPFTYESTGIETNFRDQRDPDSRSRPVFAFHTPEHLLELVQQPDTLRARLRQFPALNTAPLRECQIDAVTSLEKSLAANRPRALIQMATGSGKTFTAVTQAYRLIKHAGARRILFLVDRGNLGRQTVNEFQQFTTPDDGRKFTDLYNVQMLGPGGIDPVCKVTVSTIQRLYSQLSGNATFDDEADEHSGYEAAGAAAGKDPLEVRYNPKIPIESFDFVIVDECHRSIYNLWKQVLEYFDAFLIGLTATPSKATLGFFDRNLVTEYPYVQAVADGVNVGYDIYRIKTEVSEKGVTVKAGHDYQKRDRLTRAKRWEIQEAEETYQKTQLDRSVVVPDQIRTVIRTFREKLFTEIFTDRPARAKAMGLDEPWVPKTLIFAKDDSHAEDIVDIVRKEFGKGNDFCKKVTYRASGKSEDIIKAFRTAPEFRIAVTVDMIATGTDIKPLECLLFLRDVRSQLYFEQMKGRGTRTIDPDALASVTPDAGGKTRFVLVDAVGVTESDKTDSRPMESKPSVAFDKLLLGIAMGARDEATLTTVASRLARLDRMLSPADREEIAKVSGGHSVKQIAAALIKATDPDEIQKVAEASRLCSYSFYDEESPVDRKQGANLPHWNQAGAIYFVTFRLADSLPQEKLKIYSQERELWLVNNPEPHSPEQKADYFERFPKRLQEWVDAGYGSMILKDPAANRIVTDAIRHFEGARYTLDEFVVAANHVHALLTPKEGHELGEILHSWKSFTAKEILKLPVAARLSTKPTVWQKESWDHIVRSERSLEKFREYIRAHRSGAGVTYAGQVASMDEKKLLRDAAATLAEEAAKPLASNPALRDLLEAKRRKADVTIDHLTGDELISAGYDEEKARQLVTSWKQFLEDNQDEITALQILYNRPHAKRHLVYEELKTLAEAVARPPYHIAPAEVWKAYEHLEKRPLTTDPVKTLTNLITLVRHTVDPHKTPLAPFPDLVNARFEKWLSQQQNPESGDLSAIASATEEAADSPLNTENLKLKTSRFTESQIHWLKVIRDYIALNGAFATDDQDAYLDAWQSVDSDEGVPLAVANRVFGKDVLKPIIDELNQALIA
jgi:type I restriction enzyme R subunit